MKKNRLHTLPAIAAAVMLAASLSACSGSDQATENSATWVENPETVSSTSESSEEPESSVSSAASSSDGTTTKGSAAAEFSEAPLAAEPVVGEVAGSEGITLGSPGEMTPAGVELVDISATPYSDITAGDEITLRISGLNPELGYHAAICAAEQPQGAAAPTCTGKSTDAASQPWLKNGGGTDDISPTGTAEVTLAAATTGEGLDCAVDACVIKMFGDHSEGFRNVADLPVSFAAG